MRLDWSVSTAFLPIHHQEKTSISDWYGHSSCVLPSTWDKLQENIERDLPRLFRFLMRGLGTRETENFDWLSMVMFVPSYIRNLMEIGAADANARKEEMAALLAS